VSGIGRTQQFSVVLTTGRMTQPPSGHKGRAETCSGPARPRRPGRAAGAPEAAGGQREAAVHRRCDRDAAGGRGTATQTGRGHAETPSASAHERFTAHIRGVVTIGSITRQSGGGRVPAMAGDEEFPRVRIAIRGRAGARLRGDSGDQGIRGSGGGGCGRRRRAWRRAGPVIPPLTSWRTSAHSAVMAAGLGAAPPRAGDVRTARHAGQGTCPALRHASARPLRRHGGPAAARTGRPVRVRSGRRRTRGRAGRGTRRRCARVRCAAAPGRRRGTGGRAGRPSPGSRARRRRGPARGAGRWGRR